MSKGSVSEGKVPGFWFRQLKEHSSDEVYYIARGLKVRELSQTLLNLEISYLLMS